MESINLHSIYEKEIAQREHILNKIRNNTKISLDERRWLVTHPLYNQKWGFDVYNIVIERVDPNKWFLLKIRIESVLYDKRIIPIISVPAQKGKIVADFDVRDCNGRLKAKRSTKMLGLELNNGICEYEVEYFSNLGLLSVQYECDYVDTKQNLNKREASSTGNYDFAMMRQVVDDHTIRYFCKSPIARSFDALVFSLQWHARETGDAGDGSLVPSQKTEGDAGTVCVNPNEGDAGTVCVNPNEK